MSADGPRTPKGAQRHPRAGRSSGPGRASGIGRAGRPPAPPAEPRARGGDEAAAPRRPRLTGRAAILVLVLAVLTVSYASSMRAYLQQRAHIEDLKSQIAQRESDIDNLEREKRRYDDPAYVQAQARERFGYVMPGETSYIVLDENGEPLESESSLNDPATVIQRTPEAWWGDAWESVKLAGNPPKAPAPPLTEIDGSDQPTGSE